MKNQSQWRIAAFGLFLVLLPLLVWPPSTIAQQLRPSPASVKLGPTISLVFLDMDSASSRSAELPLTPGTRRDQPYAEGRFLPSGTGRLTHEPFAVPDSTAPANAARGNLGPTRPMRMEGSCTASAAGRFEVAHVPSAESERMRRLPVLYEEDTPFSTQVRMTVANLWSGRLQFDAFYREISADSMVRGLPQSSSVGWATPGSLTLRSAMSYGIRLSFRMPHIRTRTLYRCLLGRSG